MFTFAILLSTITLLALAYASFAAGVYCARDRNLQQVFVRTNALLGVLVLGGLGVSALRAAGPDEDAAAELLDRYTNLESLTSTHEADAEVDAEQFVQSVFAQETRPAPTAVATASDATTESPLSDPLKRVDQQFDEIVSCPIEYPSGQTIAEFASLETTIESPRPDWLNAPLFNKGTGEHWMSVTSGPWVTEVEAKTALDESIYEAVADYVDDQVGRRGAARRIRLSMNDVYQHRVIAENFGEQDEFSIGEMHLKHAKLVFTPQFRAMIAERWQQHLVASRLVKTGLGAVAVMVLLFIAFGALKRVGSS